MTEVTVRRPLAALVLALIAGGATACAGPVASAPPPVTSGSAHPGAEVPGQVLDLHNWYLTLPTGERRARHRSPAPARHLQRPVLPA
jgi:hypothetical protein